VADRSEKQANRRIRLLLLFFGLVFAAALARASWLQVVRASTLGKLAVRQHEETVVTPANRGTIFDASGSPLAIGEQATTVYADPREVTEPLQVAKAAAKAFKIDPNTLYGELLARKTQFVYVQRFADPKAASAFLADDFAGVSSYPEEKRFYPQHGVAAQVIGFAGTDDHGLGGLELEFDHQLSGRPGKQTIVRTPVGRAINVVSSVPTRQGSDVFTTIDERIQANAEAILRETVAQYGARAATAIVLDPHTGSVLAMAQAPGYDANRTANVNPELTTNRAVTDVFEPGSVFKLVTVGGALSQHLVTPTTKFKLPPCIQVADRCIHDAETRPTEWMSVSQILARSSNVGAVTIARKLGPPALEKWIARFGFGRTTGIDFPGESVGLVPKWPEQWSGTTIGNVPIGQGIAVTSVQIAAAYAAIANDGVWVQPHLVSRVGGSYIARPKRRRVVSVAVDRELKTMLTGVVDEHGATGNEAQIPGYSVAGKTGTAQIPGPHGYTTGKYVASFVGFVPVRKPRLLILVSVQEPHGSIYGGTVAAPAFRQIAQFDLQYLGIAPDQPVTTTP